MSVKVKQAEEAGCPLWMVSFGDSVSLLVTFFVMLISFTELEEAKLLELMGALKGGFRVTQMMNASLGTSAKSVRLEKSVGTSEGMTMVPRRQASVIPAHELQFQKRFSLNTIGTFDKGYVIRLLDEGVSFIIRTDSLFEEGTAKLLPKRDDIANVVADLAINLKNEIHVNGIVSDSTMVRAPNIKTPWGLASERALALKRLIEATGHFPDDRFSIGGRVEKGAEDNLMHRDEAYPPERMEIIVVGYRDLSFLNPERMIIQDRW